MPEFLKPQSPIRDKNGNYNYPITTADQVVMEDGSRLNATLDNVVYMSEATQVDGGVAIINADTLDGRPASDYALKTDLDNAGSGGGVSSWNDLTEKPFEEIITTSDTLTWDGEPTEVSFAETAYPMYKISDLTPSAEDITNGYTLAFANGYSQSFENVMEINESGIIFLPSLSVPYVMINPADLEGLPKGIYFSTAGSDYIASLTIPGYNHFENKVIKTIEPKYMPKYLQLRESTIETDTLTWDGDPEGFYGETWIKISDAVPTMQDLADGYTVETSDAGSYTESEYPPIESSDTSDGDDYIELGSHCFIQTEDFVADTGEQWPKGIYFLNYYDTYTKSLKISGYTFVIKETKLAKRYIPEDVETKAKLDTLEAKVLESSTVRNILVNSDFLNPINHREFESGEIYNDDFFIDGWTCRNAENEEKLNVAVNDTGVVLQPTTAYLTQYLQNYSNRFFGREMTVAISVDNQVYTGSATLPSNGFTLTTLLDTDKFEVKIYVFDGPLGWFLIRAKEEITIKNVGLYYGDTAPAEYQHKSYEEELLMSRAVEATENGYHSVFGVNMELLWENASPSSAFAEQSLTITDSDSYLYLIEFNGAAIPNTVLLTSLVVRGANTRLIYDCFSSGGYNNSRAVSQTVTNNNVIFNFGAPYTLAKPSATATQSNDVCIPTRIYGIKGVTE